NLLRKARVDAHGCYCFCSLAPPFAGRGSGGGALSANSLTVALAERAPHPASPRKGRGEVERTAPDSTYQHACSCAALVAPAQTELSCPGISFPEGYVRRLLFLNGIKAFEAAARTGSFAAAGTELNVSAAA